MKLFTITLIAKLFLSCTFMQEHKNTISKNGMELSWYHKQDRIYFQMSAPTDGWVAIGFNTHTGTKDAYLLMGHVYDAGVDVQEHYTFSPGNYKSFQDQGIPNYVDHITGEEKEKHTSISFSVPIEPHTKYQKNLSKGEEYTMIIAFSREDDYQHHSMMRTSVNVKL